jgi:hypothetical protein
MILDQGFEFFDDFDGFRSKEHVVNIDDDDEKCFGIVVIEFHAEYCTIDLAACESQFLEGESYFLVPLSSSLLESV